MQRKILSLTLILAAAGYGVYYFFFRQNPDLEEEPKQEAMKMDRQTDAFTLAVTETLHAYYKIARAIEQKNEAAYRQSLDSFETKWKAIAIDSLKAEPTLIDFVKDLQQTLSAQAMALKNEKPGTAASGFQSLSDYLFDFLRTTKYAGEPVYQLRSGENDSAGGYNWLSNYPGGNSPYTGNPSSLQLVDSIVYR